ncbi:hypothetical protein ACO2JX_17025 [Leptospira interrogans]|nr:hypothetical protein [Leptospira interrogans]MBE8343991.1 hypothetical protein [Leptospira interrogans serovar Pomona]
MFSLSWFARVQSLAPILSRLNTFQSRSFVIGHRNVGQIHAGRYSEL